METMAPKALLEKIRQNMARAVVGKGEVLDLLLIALICGGHALIEDVPLFDNHAI